MLNKPERHSEYSRYLSYGSILAVVFFLSACSEYELQEAYIGSWRSQGHKITVRTEPQWMEFEFTSDTVSTILTINADGTAHGSIGKATFTNGIVQWNGPLPSSMTGVEFIIECDLKGRIFEKDPLEQKEVEFWVGPVEDDMQDVELRYTTSNAKFPMAGIDFERYAADQ